MNKGMNQEDKNEYRKNVKRISLILKLVALVVIIIGVPLYIFFFHHEILEDASNLKNVEQWLLQYKGKSALVYIGAQILQIIICVIPGQALQVVAGYLYGFWLAFGLSLIGAFLGSIIVFYLAQFLGHDAMHILFGEGKVMEMLDKLNSKRGMLAVFVIFLIPGIPKDLCTYAAGISKMKIRPFLIISLIARSPGMMCSIAIGRQIMHGNYHSAIIIAAIVVILFIIGILFREKVFKLFDAAYDKLIQL